MKTVERRSVCREFRPLAQVAWRAGWRIVRTGGQHLKWLAPAPSKVIVISAWSPSDWRSVHNLRASLRKAGLDV